MREVIRRFFKLFKAKKPEIKLATRYIIEDKSPFGFLVSIHNLPTWIFDDIKYQSKLLLEKDKKLQKKVKKFSYLLVGFEVKEKFSDTDHDLWISLTYLDGEFYYIHSESDNQSYFRQIKLKQLLNE